MESVSPYLKNDQRFRESDRVFNKWDRAYEGGGDTGCILTCRDSCTAPLCLSCRAKAVVLKTGEMAIRVRRWRLLALCYAYASF